MALTHEDLLASAEAEVTSIEAADAAPLRTDPDTVFVDIRDVRELDRDGMIPGARHAPRGMLEFWISKASPYHKPWLAEDKTYIFYCASGWRSLLAAQVAQKMGLRSMSLRGGYSGWKKSGLETGEREKTPEL
ncbi:MAG: rhodanese-like domain-containing protein [Hyphomonas sp.]|uniref:rhodanese-like domain-containing protein n=1 Tax=Hyphomonas sp. TaxID=87 RepID=UPI00352784AF